MPGYTLPEVLNSTSEDDREEKSKKRSFKYGQAMKHLIPFRLPPKNKNVLPTRYAGLFSYLSTSWMTSLMWKAYKKNITEEDLWSLPREETAEVNGDRLERLWNEEKTRAKKSNRKPRLWRPVWQFTKTRLLICQLLDILAIIFFYVGPIVYFQNILEYINGVEVDHMYGLSLFLGKILIGSFMPVLIFHALVLVGIHNGCRLVIALQTIIYRKTLTLKSGGENLSAQVINFSSNDIERIYEACLSIIYVVELPFVFLLVLSYCLYAYGPLSSVGFGVYLLFYPTMALIAKYQGKIREKTIKETDRRVGLMSEILNSIRLIKMYAWEEPFAKKIAGIRQCEMKMHRIGAFLGSITNTMAPSVGILASIATLLCFTLTGKAVTSTDAFMIFTLFNLMAFTVSLIPYVSRCLAEANVSLDRMERLLNLPEHEPTSASKDSAAFAIQLQGANYSWEMNEISDKDTNNTDKNDVNEDNVDSPKLSRKLHKGQQESSSGSLAESTPGSIADSTVDSISGSKAEPKKKVISTSGTLFRVNLIVPHGKLIGVCGSIGAGKSSLISAICGDMKLEQGSMYINGKVALVTQQAWIYSGTLRDNLLLGSTYEEAYFKEVIRHCCLQSDLDLFPAGDLTEIGDRGINLSGGQKQRVNLGRAVYSNRDIYLLDDPLSAVDTKVANAIFNDCIKGYLKGKTVLLVTHALHLLEQCDEIVVMNEGRISEQGTHSQLLDSRGDYFLMVGGMNSQEEDSKDEKTEKKLDANAMKGEDTEEGLGLDGKLTTEETKQVGSFTRKVYKAFIKVCGGWFVSSCLLFSVILFVLLRLLNMIWLQIWMDEGDGRIADRLQNVTKYNLTLPEDELKGSVIHNPLLWMYQTVYGISFLALVIVGISKGIGIAFSVLKGASKLHNEMFKSILRSPMSFFDTTPSGQILNRFSRDLDQLDTRIPYFLEFVLQGILLLAGQAILVCTIYVWFSIPIVVVTVLFILLDIFLHAGVRELKRIDNRKKSPVLQHIGSSLAGLPVIRTFDQQKLFTDRMHQHLDDHGVAQLVHRLSNRWYVFRTDMLAFLINTLITAVSIFTKGMVSTAAVGLALSTMSAVCDYFPYLMNMKTEFQSRFTSVERLVEYAYELDSEVPREKTVKEPPKDWPEFGRVEMKVVCLRYRPDLPLVLHDIEATFAPGEKVGVVGRTGAGKSSLIATLLRLVEVESGSILIDGIDVATLGLHTLRSAVSVIPQDPVLFQGSIRYNLDPFEEHSDAAVWEALEQSHLKRIVQQQERGLQSIVATAGENFSVGERQLICLTRALLRKSKILLLDEATASVDLETDQMIQTTIRKAFVQSTVITIAHRLNTVTTYDRILVLQEGRVMEFDSPENLMKKEGSLFREMMSAMGVSNVEEMKALT